MYEIPETFSDKKSYTKCFRENLDAEIAIEALTVRNFYKSAYQFINRKEITTRLQLTLKSQQNFQVA